MTKIYKMLTDEAFRNAYRINKFDDLFTQQIIGCFNSSENLDNLSYLTSYLLEIMGGFDVGSWTLYR